MRFAPGVRPLELPEAAAVFEDYERRNRLAAPLIRRVLSRMAGFRYDGSPQARLRLVEALPLVAFTYDARLERSRSSASASRSPGTVSEMRKKPSPFGP